MKPLYKAYLLRLWSDSDRDGGEWRASLEDVHGDARHGFSRLETLMAYLYEQTSGTEPNDDRQPKSKET